MKNGNMSAVESLSSAPSSPESSAKAFIHDSFCNKERQALPKEKLETAVNVFCLSMEYFGQVGQDQVKLSAPEAELVGGARDQALANIAKIYADPQAARAIGHALCQLYSHENPKDKEGKQIKKRNFTLEDVVRATTDARLATTSDLHKTILRFLSVVLRVWSNAFVHKGGVFEAEVRAREANTPMNNKDAASVDRLIAERKKAYYDRLYAIAKIVGGLGRAFVSYLLMQNAYNLPAFDVGGMGDAAVKHAQEGLKAALGAVPRENYAIDAAYTALDEALANSAVLTAAAKATAGVTGRAKQFASAVGTRALLRLHPAVEAAHSVHRIRHASSRSPRFLDDHDDVENVGATYRTRGGPYSRRPMRNVDSPWGGVPLRGGVATAASVGRYAVPAALASYGYQPLAAGIGVGMGLADARTGAYGVRSHTVNLRNLHDTPTSVTDLGRFHDSKSNLSLEKEGPKRNESRSRSPPRPRSAQNLLEALERLPEDAVEEGVALPKLSKAARQHWAENRLGRFSLGQLSGVLQQSRR
jgi:hypothetical protein